MQVETNGTSPVDISKGFGYSEPYPATFCTVKWNTEDFMHRLLRSKVKPPSEDQRTLSNGIRNR
jgi:hypothetical protein